MQAGDLVGGFEIEGPARSGGMGEIYRARDRLSGQAVALKILNESGVDADAERFFREARILSDLRHPGIVRYLGHGRTIAGEPYLAMEWLDGEDLGERLRRAGLTIDETVLLGVRVG